MNKKAYSTGFTWIYGLVMIFGLGILFIVFSQVFNAHLIPVIKSQVNGTTGGIVIDNETQLEINNNIDKYMDFFNVMPFILFFVVVIYMIVAAVRKEKENEFQ